MRLVVTTLLLALVALTAARLRAQQRRRASWRRTDGIVVAEEFAGYGGGHVAGYDQVIMFRLRGGGRFTGVPERRSTVGTPMVGRQVPVWYDPADPARFEAEVRWTDRVDGVLLCAAVVLALVDIALWLPWPS
jgi:hypothetical protein